MNRVTDARLDMYISGKYEWPTLPPQDVKSMAIELGMLRNLAKNAIAMGNLAKASLLEEHHADQN